MKRVRVLAVVVLAALSGTACTRQQQAVFWQVWHKEHPHYCTEDDQLWNGKDHHCESPLQFCKSKFGPKAYAQEDKNGDIGCYRVK